MSFSIYPVSETTLADAVAIWNCVVEDGVAFPQEAPLTLDEGRTFFAAQSFTGVCVDDASGRVLGMYILHPNNVGRCGHICNASYAVARDARGQGVGECLVRDCIARGKALGFGVLQFNAVVATNHVALSLYKKLGFTQLGVIPKGFHMDDGHYEDIIPHYIEL
ncbi:MAG: GNAT family N-acetyltransferase [Clostridia bacterium]|nr:GNAT family N-acetyltransferase [Clostridia bacterium]